MSDAANDSALAVLEEVMERALDEAQTARRLGQRDRLRAFVEVLSWAKQQAAVMDLPPFANHALNQLDPESLLAAAKQAA